MYVCVYIYVCVCAIIRLFEDIELIFRTHEKSFVLVMYTNRLLSFRKKGRSKLGVLKVMEHVQLDSYFQNVSHSIYDNG